MKLNTPGLGSLARMASSRRSGINWMPTVTRWRRRDGSRNRDDNPPRRRRRDRVARIGLRGPVRRAYRIREPAGRALGAESAERVWAFGFARSGCGAMTLASEIRAVAARIRARQPEEAMALTAIAVKVARQTLTLDELVDDER